VSLANRARLARNIAQAVRDTVGGRLAIIAKLNMDGGVPSGFWIDESIQVARWLEADGTVDALELTAGSSLLNPMYLFTGDAPVREMPAGGQQVTEPGHRGRAGAPWSTRKGWTRSRSRTVTSTCPPPGTSRQWMAVTGAERVAEAVVVIVVLPGAQRTIRKASAGGHPRRTRPAIWCQSTWLASASAIGRGIPRPVRRVTRHSWTSRASKSMASWPTTAWFRAIVHPSSASRVDAFPCVRLTVASSRVVARPQDEVKVTTARVPARTTGSRG
jgi:hypothetical protein